jgi:N-acetylglucosaminyldiphosphoundecaprenol N-acetyl-beta-D-mannosaminyltransferase
MNARRIAEIKLQNWSEHDLYTRINAALKGSSFYSVITPNPEFLLLVKNNAELRGILNKADLHAIDGMGLQVASRALFGEAFKSRVTGADLLGYVIDKNHNRRILFITGDEIKSVEGDNMTSLNPGSANDPAFMARIVDGVSDNDIVILGIPMKQQLLTVKALKDSGKKVFVMGVGGAILMYFGYVARAPMIIRKLGMEWMWRLIMDPSIVRLKRIMRATVSFPLWILSVKLRGNYGKED